jgi:hypothetical protein
VRWLRKNSDYPSVERGTNGLSGRTFGEIMNSLLQSGHRPAARRCGASCGCRASNLFFKLAYLLKQCELLSVGRQCAALSFQDLPVEFSDLPLQQRAKLPTSAVLRAQAICEKQGFMKLLVGANDDSILGFTMIGSEAGEVMAAVQIAMLAGVPYLVLRDAIFAHPTMVEGLDLLLAKVPTRCDQPVLSAV